MVWAISKEGDRVGAGQTRPYPVTLLPNGWPFLSQTFSRIIPQTRPQPSSFYTHLAAYEDGTDTVFQNVGIQNSDTGELPRRKHTTFRTQRKFEINYNAFRTISATTYPLEQHHIPEYLNFSADIARNSNPMFDKDSFKRMYLIMELSATLLNKPHLFLSFNNEVTTWIMRTLVHFC